MKSFINSYFRSYVLTIPPGAEVTHKTDREILELVENILNLPAKGYPPLRHGEPFANDATVTPIILSPVIDETRRPFPVEIVVVHRLPGKIVPFQVQHFELPKVHLDINELIWELALPEGYELMKGTSNVDLSGGNPGTPLLDNSVGFPGLRMPSSASAAGGRDRLLGFMGLLPVKFQLPALSWKTTYTRLQIEPDKPSPFIAGTLVTPRQGKGRIFSWLMIAMGAICGWALLFLATRQRKILWLIVLAVGGILLGVAVVFKLYQADHSFKMGFMLTFVGSLLFRLYGWKPEESEK